MISNLACRPREFGDRAQAGIEQFGITVDVVQHLLDQLMVELDAGGGDAAPMGDHTYKLFAMSKPTHGTTVRDLLDAVATYAITALQGSKAEVLHARHDVSHDADQPRGISWPTFGRSRPTS